MSKIFKLHWLKKKKIAYFAFGFALCLIVIGGLKSVALAQEGQAVEAPEDLVLRAVANYVIDHGDGIVAGKLLDFLLQRKEERVGILREDAARSPIDRVCYRDSDGISCVAEGWEQMTLPGSSTSTVAEPNRLSVPIIITYAEIELKGVVSSTFSVAAGTSTLSSGPAFNASTTVFNYPDGIIQRTLIPSTTLTINIENNPGYENIVVATSTGAAVLSRSGGSRWEVPTSTYVMVFLQAGGSEGVCERAGQLCEAVTSSNYATFTGIFRYKYHYNVNL